MKSLLKRVVFLCIAMVLAVSLVAGCGDDTAEEKPTIKYEIIDEYDQPVKIKKSWWKRLFGL